MLVDVALPLPMPRTFTYRVEGATAGAGTRVLVPFGKRRLVGWVVGPAAETVDPAKIRPVTRVLDADTAVPADLLALCRWVAEYYVAPLGQVLRTALPVLLSAPARPEPPLRTRRIIRLTRELPSLQLRDELFGRAKRQRECYELLETVGGSAEVAHLTGHVGFSASVLQGLVDRALAEFAEVELERDPFAVMPAQPPAGHRPTPAQAAVLAELVAAARGAALARTAMDSPPGRVHLEVRGGPRDPARADAHDPRPFLLHGVTGSGKTLVYIELLREVVERQGRGAIVLVPEIALTPQTVSRFRAHFGDRVAVLHSALSDGERFDAWRALRSGEKRIAVGARSAIFAPVADLGAIVVDEEHESTYKQSDTEPRYHAREVAVVRAGMAGAVCVLGSATPALESWQNVRAGKYRLLRLPDRVEGRPMPPVRVIDLRKDSSSTPESTEEARSARRGSPELRDSGSGNGPVGQRAAGLNLTSDRVASASAAPDAPRQHADPGSVLSVPPSVHSGVKHPDEPRKKKRPILSPPLVEAIRARLERGEQTILLLNRRGYASFVQCTDCGAVWHCHQCNVSLTYHRGRQRLVCHYCFHEEPAPVTCDACGSGELSFRGIGTEQVERIVAETFPAARIARMDVDTTSGKWAHHQILERVERREVDILLGTQMIAKGLDFPGVTLVGVVNADVGLNLPDFRAAERSFQLLTQVAGRAGRGPLGGEVLVQTALPGHYAVQAAVAHDFAAFAERELQERAEPNYPPHCRLANIVVSGLEEEAVQEAATDAADWLRALLLAHRVDGVEITGPAPCPIDRVRGRWRWHFLLRSRSAGLLGQACRRLHEDYSVRGGVADLRLAIDRDPVALL